MDCSHSQAPEDQRQQRRHATNHRTTEPDGGQVSLPQDDEKAPINSACGSGGREHRAAPSPHNAPARPNRSPVAVPIERGARPGGPPARQASNANGKLVQQDQREPATEQRCGTTLPSRCRAERAQHSSTRWSRQLARSSRPGPRAPGRSPRRNTASGAIAVRGDPMVRESRDETPRRASSTIAACGCARSAREDR